MRYTTYDGLVVEPQNHPALWMADFAEFGPQNSAVQFWLESETTHGISRRVCRDEATSCGACGRQMHISGVGPFCPRSCHLVGELLCAAISFGYFIWHLLENHDLHFLGCSSS
jgi:hypothetical protein